MVLENLTRENKWFFFFSFLSYEVNYLSLGGFPGGSDGKESTCNAGDLSSIPGLGRSPGEGIGYPLPDSWAFQVSQMVKNPPAMKDFWV